MGVNTFHSLVCSLLQGGDIDIDVLLMIKDEVCIDSTCTYICNCMVILAFSLTCIFILAGVLQARLCLLCHENHWEDSVRS
jgi:hypothetical protein